MTFDPPTDREPALFGVGQVIGQRYRVERVLGEGGFGVVYGATDVHDGTRAAVKVLSPHIMSMAGGADRFKREAELARRIDHPNAVRVLGAGTDWASGSLFIAFELLDGRSLEDEILAVRGMPPRRVAEIAIEVLQALEHAHGLGIIHRDIKPGNIYLMSNGRVKVLDFGIAKSLNPNTYAGLTQAGQTVGTPAYMPREQLVGEQLVPATDLFALGVVMIEMLGGRPLYGSDTSLIDILRVRLEGQPLQAPPWLPRTALGPIIERATRMSASERYKTAAEMARALQTAELGPAPLGPPIAPTKASPTAFAATDASIVAPNPLIGAAPGTQPAARPWQSPTIVASAQTRRSSGVGYLVVGVVIALAGIAAAAWIAFGDPPKKRTRRDDTEETSRKKKKARASDEETDDTDAYPFEPTPPPRPQPPPPQPTPTLDVPPPTPPPVARTKVCGELRMAQPIVRREMESLGWRVTGQQLTCAGNLINFRCDGPQGRGHTYAKGSVEGSVVGLTFPSPSAADAFIASQSDGTHARKGAQVLVIDMPPAEADRLLPSVCK